MQSIHRWLFAGIRDSRPAGGYEEYSGQEVMMMMTAIRGMTLLRKRVHLVFLRSGLGLGVGLDAVSVFDCIPSDEDCVVYIITEE